MEAPSAQNDRPRALIVDGNPIAVGALVDLVEERGFEALSAAELPAARTAVDECRPDLLLIDPMLLDGGDGDALGQLPEELLIEGIPVVGRSTGASSTTPAAGNGRLAGNGSGAPSNGTSLPCDPPPGSIDLSRLENLLARARRRFEADPRAMRRPPSRAARFGSMVGSSPAMLDVYELIEKAAPTDASVLIVGETGTGKELAAETLHRSSRRADMPFLAVNCGALTASLIESELFGHEKGSFTGAHKRHRGYFERASGGTLLLDEIAEMPLELQVKLLRVLESGRVRRLGGHREIEVDVRVLAATNRRPDEAVEEGALREDLLYRLRVFPIELPPLRQREGDVEELATGFLRELNRSEAESKRFSTRALELLVDWHWPGNVRELHNVVRRAFILADEVIGAECLPDEIVGVERPEGPTIHLRVGTPLAECARRLTLATLEHLDGNRRRTAEALGISAKTLYNRLKKYETASPGAATG